MGQNDISVSGCIVDTLTQCQTYVLFFLTSTVSFDAILCRTKRFKLTCVVIGILDGQRVSEVRYVFMSLSIETLSLKFVLS
jgi:hypothetical protein